MRLVNREYTVRLVLNKLGDYQVEVKDPQSGMWKLYDIPRNTIDEALEIFYQQAKKDKSLTHGGRILCQA